MTNSMPHQNDEMPAWKRIAQERLAKKNPPAEFHDSQRDSTSTRGGSDCENTRAQTFTQDELYADAIPDVNPYDDLPEVHKVSDQEVERILSTTPYERQYALFGKGDAPEFDAARGEHIIRCAYPDHQDTHPSASFRVDNSGKDVYNCFKCGGGDIYTIAAAHYGMNADSTDLPYIKRKLAGQLSGSSVEDYGTHEVLATPVVREIIELQTKKEQDESKSEMEEMRLRLIENEENAQAEQAAQEQPAQEQPAAAPVEDFTEAVPDIDTIVPPPLPTPESTPPSSQSDPSFPLDREPPNVDDYTEMLAPNTFLSDFYNAASQDQNPNDFHFFHGLLAVGYAAGRDATYSDYPDVTGNLYLCFVANSGTGKSRSRTWLDKIMYEALPWDDLDQSRSGVRIVSDPGSGETLIEALTAKEIPYPNALPTDPASTSGRVKGFIDMDELETFIRKADKPGSTIRSVVTSMYGSSRVSTRSKTGGDHVATEPFLSLAANVPPESLRTLVHKGDAFSGFLNRFTFVSVTTEKEQRFKTKEVPFDTSSIGLKLREILSWCQARRSITLSPEAEQLLEDFFAVELSKTSPLVNEDADAMFARLELAVKKYLLLFAVNEMKEVIDVPVAEKAIRLYWISKRNLTTVGGKVGTSATGELEGHIMEKVVSQFKKEAEPITAGDIMGKKCQVRRKVKALGLESKDFDTAMRNLVSTGSLIEIRGDKSDKRVKPKYIPHID